MNEHVRRINRSLVCGWLLIVIILFVMYLVEVIKGERTLLYLLVFTAVTAIPADIAYYLFRREPDRHMLRYEIVAGYFVMYVFVMATGSTNLVFCYILPLLSLLVLYHEPKLVVYTGVASLVLNVLNVWKRAIKGELTLSNTKDVEIQFALLFLCFLGAFLATRLYDDIHRKNEEYTAKLNAQNEDIQRMTIQTIMTIANTIDAKDEYTRGHSRRVAEYAAAIAKEMGMSEEEVSDIRYIGLLHDIGKIGIPDAVLNKPGKLTDEEYRIMKSHTTIGAEILKDINMIEGLDVGAKYHHERYDGKGYPDGIAGDDIPRIARIISVADAYDAMSSNRIYRRHLDASRVTEEFKKGTGVQWDPACVEALLRLLEENRLPEMRPETEMVRHATTILTRVISVAESSAAGGKKNMDELTGVFGRDAGKDAIQDAIYQTGSGWMLLFNVDHFHRINQVNGFAIGDAYLKVLAEMIEKAYPNSIVARFGSDEFAVFVPGDGSSVSADELAGRFYRGLDELTVPGGATEKLSVSVGMTEVFTEKDRIMVLYENANKALYVAKQNGGGTYYCHQVDAEEASADEPAADIKRLIDEARADDGSLSERGKLRELLAGAVGGEANFSKVALFTVKSGKGENPGIDERDTMTEQLRTILAGAVREEDVILKYSSTQYAAFLGETSSADARDFVDRVFLAFFKICGGGRFELQYDIGDLTS